jgi:hypothetical protein
MKSPFIFVPDRSIIRLDLETPTIGFQGFVSWRLIRRGRIVAENREMLPNQITNNGIDGLATANAQTLTSAIAVGTGATPPLQTDTQLQAEVITGGREAITSSTSGFVGIGGSVTEDYWWWRRVYLIPETKGNGSLTEVGFFNQTTVAGSVMWARHLFKDVGGTPTTIIKTSADQLEVTYEIRAFPPLGDVVQAAFPLSVEGSSHDITMRAYDCDGSTGFSRLGTNAIGQLATGRAWTGALGVRTSTPGGVSIASTAASQSAYVANSLQIQENFEWSPASSNSNFGVLSVSGVGGFESFQCGFNPVINKNNTKKLTISVYKKWGIKP